MSIRLHILGGGIGGMTAALHLARLRHAGHLPQGATITIYEASQRLGGKAASQLGPWVNGSGRWPGEHGFRFFPNFYRCIVDTLKYIPLTETHVQHRKLRPSWAGKTVYDLLHGTSHGAIAARGTLHQVKRAESLDELPGVISSLLGGFDIEARDIRLFTVELTRFLLTSHERAVETWEHETLNTFIERNRFSEGMVTFLKSLRALSAMRADRGSLRTLFFTMTQMLADFDEEYALWDALLPGPTDYLMLEPWQQELERLDVNISYSARVSGLEFRPHEPGLPATLSRVSFEGSAAIEATPEDHFLMALPFEVARPLLVNAAGGLPPALAALPEIKQRPDNSGDGAEPMVGVQFFLSEDVEMVSGHTVYPTAPWAMTSVSQAQFWRSTFAVPLDELFEAPELKGVLSCIISAWDNKAPRIGKAPETCTAEEIAREAFAQVLEGSGVDLSWEQVLGFHVDADIQFSPGTAFCPTPLWVSPRGSFSHRPLADFGADNLFIASDWARTETDVGSMESADEAARWSVRAVARRLPEPPPESALPQVPRLRLWRAVEIARRVDKWLFEHGIPHPLELEPATRRLLSRLLRELRAGTRIGELASAFVRLAFPGGDTPEHWQEMLEGRTTRPELDEVIRFLDDIDDDEWPGPSDDRGGLLEGILRRVSALRR